MTPFTLYLHRVPSKSTDWLAQLVRRFPTLRPAIMRAASAATLMFLSLLSVEGRAANDAPGLALPSAAILENAATSCRVVSPTELELSAPAGTDLYISSDGKYRINRSPRLLFQLTGPFIFTAKIRPELKAMWDAGALMLFNDGEHFAKFCFERDPHGETRIVSVVCNGVADDCNSMPVPVPEGVVYYRITGSVPGNTFTFYASVDGKKWSLLRNFRILKTDALRLGFSAQSPSGAGCTVHFSEISVKRGVPTDYWTGN